MFEMKTYTRVIVVKTEPLTDEEITSAFHGNENAQWYRALVQLINDLRLEFPLAAAQRAEGNNAIAMARDLGAYEALSNLLIVLERRVKSD